MRRRLSISVLFAFGLLAIAAAQEPPSPSRERVAAPPPLFTQSQPAPAPAPAKEQDAKDKDKNKEKKVDPTEAAVAAALANDPDVKVAKAKVQLAEAEVAKAKQAVVLKVMTLMATIKELKQGVTLAQARVNGVERLAKGAVVDHTQVLEERAKLESAQAALARAETELNLLTGGGVAKNLVGSAALEEDATRAAVLRSLAWLAKQQQDNTNTARHQYADSILAAMREWEAVNGGAVKGPVAERLRTALDKPVKLGTKGEKISLAKAVEILKKDAGFDVGVRAKELDLNFIFITSDGEQLPVGAWFQLFADATPGSKFVVREYGLLLTPEASAPPNAPSVDEFWKQKPEAKKEAAPEPKGK
jgi:hypothetical protein